MQYINKNIIPPGNVYAVTEPIKHKAENEIIVINSYNEIVNANSVFGKFPVRTELSIIPVDNNSTIGWTVGEIVGVTGYNYKGLKKIKKFFNKLLNKEK